MDPKYLRFAEKIALEKFESQLAGEFELLVGLDLFGQEFDRVMGKPTQGSADFVLRGYAEIYLDDIGQGNQRLKRLVIDKVIEGYGITLSAQHLTNFLDFRCWRDILKNLDNDFLVRKG